MSAGAVNIRLGAIVTDFLAGFQQAGAAVSRLSTQLNSNLSASFAASDRQSKIFDRGIGRLASNLQNTGQSLSTYISLPLAGLGVASLKAASDLEQAGVSFKVLLKDANLAASTINDLKAFAASTPFEFTEVQQGAKQLLAYGFAVGDLKTLLTDAGNLASGFGVEIGEVTRVLGRIKSGDFGEAFERLRDFGIGRDVLEAKGLKFDKSGQFQGSVQQAFSVIQAIIRERFGGQMEEQSKTLGGIFSNIKDQAAFALSDIGQQLIETFNLKELGKGLVDFIGKIRDGFLSLPAPIQRASVLIGTLAAAAGPLSFGLGTIIKFLPTLASGFAAMTGPVGLAVAAIIGAGILIVQNWDKIKQALINAGIWTSLVNLVRTGIDSVKALFSTGVGFLIATWDKWKGVIIPVATTVFEVLGVVFKTGLDLLTGVLKVFTGLFTGSWSTFGEGLQNITVTIFNAITGLFTAGFRGILNLTANALDAVGADEKAKALRNYAESLQAIIIPLKNTKKAIADSAIELPGVTVTAKRNNNLQTNLSGGSNGVGSAGDNKTFTRLDTLKRLASQIESQIQGIGTDAPQKLFEQLSAIRREIEQIESLINQKPIDLGKLNPLSASQGSSTNAQLPYLDSLNNFINTLNETQSRARDAKDSFVAMLGIGRAQLSDAGAGLFSGLGDSIAKGENPLKTVLKTIVNFIGDFAIKLGTAILLMGKLETVAAAIPGLAPLFALTGPAKIIAGLGFIAGGGLIKGLAAFADGGIVSGPTLGLVGEYAGAKNNPEVIAPLDKLKGMIGGGVNRVTVDDILIDGYKLRMVMKNVDDDLTRLG